MPPTWLSSGADVDFLSVAQVAELDLGEALGQGTSASVHLVSGIDDVAVKVSRTSQFEESLLGEAHALALCDGGFAPRLHGVGRLQDGRLALVMGRAPGKNLRDVLSMERFEREDVAWRVLVGGARALHQLHAWGLGHGDFKPENIHLSLESPERLVLVDFGLSSSAEAVTGGTPRYLPPGVFVGDAVSARRADAHALAMTVAEIVCPDAWAAGACPEELAVAMPRPLSELLQPLLCPRYVVPPGIEWLLRELDEPLAQKNASSDAVLTDIRREYIATRMVELDSTREGDWQLSAGPHRKWVWDIVVRLSAIRDLAGSSQEGSPSAPLGDMSHHERSRFLGRLIGPGATSWGLVGTSDGALIQALCEQGRRQPLRALSFRQLVEHLEPGAAPRLGEPGTDPIDWAMQLGRRPVALSLLRKIAREGGPPSIELEAARAARQMGESWLARRLLRGSEGPAVLVERALVLSRLGEDKEAESLRSKVVASTKEDDESHQRALAALARTSFDRKEYRGALECLKGAAPCAQVDEVRALSLLALGRDEEALEATHRGFSFSGSEEESARLLAVRGMAHHQRGEPDEARRCFQHACEMSARAGAVLEEATYCTGWAAAATDMGYLGESLQASERAEALFEALGLEGRTARALLSKTAVLSALGAHAELSSVARRGIALARRSGDTICEAYLNLCLCDATDEAPARTKHAERASQLLEAASDDDRLRASARLVVAGKVPHEQAEQWAGRSTSRQARADWYGARAEVLDQASASSTTEHTREVGREVVENLLELARAGPPLLSMGKALVSGAHLGLRLGLAEEASALFREARQVASVLLAHATGEHRSRAASLPWVEQAQGSRVSDATGGEQLSDVESLLMALSQRRGFRALLDQTLDLLLLWTGVQRGLLLLRAPGERLVVRAARNLDQHDLGQEQRELSYSMARRALKEGRPVVAVDAMNDVSAIHRSVHSLNLRSVLAVPLAARGEVLGVAYLDDRVRRGAFGERELSWVRLIGTIAALAILDERDRLKLNRALRRARRAERRLEGELNHREAELEIAERELSRMGGDGKLRGDYSHIVGRSQAMISVLKLVDRVAQSDVPVLITGESGTGKELVARAIASSGSRKARRFVAENCSAVPETLLESALFGHQKGAFTGATRNQPGLFELAHGGTLFLDEIGDMPLSMQTKLLRVLQDGEVRPLGAERSRKVDVRVIVATHKNLEDLVERGEFREDLYYRLNVVKLAVPALRERREDIVVLVDHFLAKYSPDQRRTLSSAALLRLSNFSWPGNVRQLENEVRKMVVLGGNELTAADLSPDIISESSGRPEATTLRDKVDALERRLVIEALEQANGNRTRAAEALGLSRFGLQKMSQRLEIQLPKKAPKAGRIKDRGLDETR